MTRTDARTRSAKLRYLCFAILAAVGWLDTSPCKAQAVAEANIVRSEHASGGELGGGYSVFAFHGLRLTPAVGAFFYQGNNDRYYMDDNGGSPRCRDSETGRYAPKGKCDDLSVKAYARAELTYTIPTSFTLGVGERLMSSHIRPYGLFALPLAPKISLKAFAGQRYFGGGVFLRL